MTVQLNISYRTLMNQGQYDTSIIDGWRIVAKWLRENIEGYFDRTFCSEEAQVQIFFELETDAMAFKLVWHELL